MSHFARRFSRQDLQRPQLWVLLWMLPYLIFSVWASPLHLHSPEGRDIPLSALVGQSSTRSSSHETPQIEKTSATQNAVECFLCDWSANASSSLLIGVASLPRPVEQAQIVSLEAAQSPRLCRARTSRNRGPPAVFSL